MKMLRLLLLFPVLAWSQIWYSQTDVISNNTVALTNKTFDCNLNTCLNLPGGSSNAPSVFVVYDVLHYGAKCDGATDDTTAIQATIAAAKTFYNAATYNNVAIIGPANKQCYVSAPLDFTGFTNTNSRVLVDWHGGYIHWTNTGNMLIDAMSSQNMRWQHINLQGNATYNGIQIGRTVSSTTPAGLMEFNDMFVAGSFGDAACYDYASEQDTFLYVTCSNVSTSGGFGLIMDGSNHWNVPTLASGGQQIAADTATSFLQSSFIQGQFKSQSGPNGAGIWMGNAQQVRFDNSYCYDNFTAGPTYALGCIWLYETAPGSSDFGLKDAIFDVHSEPTMANTFYITGPGSGAAFTATPKIRGLRYKDAYLFASTDVLQTDNTSNITNVTLTDTDLEILGGPTSPTFGTFDTPANYTFSGKWASYATGRWNGTAFVGNYYAEDNGTAKMSINSSFNALSLISGSTVQAAGASFIQWSGREFLSSPGAGNLELGKDAGGVAVDQTLSAQNAVASSQTDTIGANLAIVSGLGTGAATGTTITMQTPVTGTTGTTAQTPVNGLVLGATAISVGNATSNPTFSFLGTGQVNFAGGTKFASTLYASTTAPTINSHFNTSGDSVTATSTAAFQVTVGSGTGTTTGSLTMPTASTGWACSVADVTTPASHNVTQTASSTTGITVTDYSRTAGTAQNMANGDKLVFHCGAF